MKTVDPENPEQKAVIVTGKIVCPIASIMVGDDKVEKAGLISISIAIDTSNWQANLERKVVLDGPRLDTSRSLVDRHSQTMTEERAVGASTLTRTIEGAQDIVGLSTRNEVPYQEDTYNKTLEAELRGCVWVRGPRSLRRCSDRHFTRSFAR